MIVYNKRPLKDASTKAWDYIVENYGTPEQMIFNPCCCGQIPFWSAKVNGKLITVKPADIRGFVANRGKIKFQSTK
jgi:hypothetical protein